MVGLVFVVFVRFVVLRFLLVWVACLVLVWIVVWCWFGWRLVSFVRCCAAGFVRLVCGLCGWCLVVALAFGFGFGRRAGLGLFMFG